MKVYTMIVVFLSVFLVACNTNNTQNISFEQATAVFSNNIKNIQKTTELLWFTWQKATNLSLDIYGENQDFKLSSSLLLSWVANYQDSKAQLNTQIDLYFRDKSEQKENILSWFISNILIDNNLYFFINNSFLNIGTWNYQGELLTLISQNLENKRIRVINTKNNKIKLLNNNIQSILDVLSQVDKFIFVEEVSYEWDLAYKIEILSENRQTNTIKGMLIVHSPSDIELKIEKANVYLWDQKHFIKWNIWSAGGSLRFQNAQTLEKTTQISWEKTKRNISLNISNQLNGQPTIDLGIKLSPQTTQQQTTVQINGIINISPLLIYGSDLEKNIQIDINGQYVFKDISQTNITQPGSYILREQILWDQFSLETIMAKTK